MGLRHFIARLLPRRIQNWCLNWWHVKRDVSALRSEAAALCRCDLLGMMTEGELRRHLISPDLAAEWGVVESQLKRSGLLTATGGVNAGDQRALYSLARSLRITTVLEIGTHVGCSTIVLAHALKRNCDVTGQHPAKLITVDCHDVGDAEGKPWLKYGARHSPQEMVSIGGFHEVVSFITAHSLSYLRDCKMTFDLIFLDGDHAAKAVYREVALATGLLNKGGYIILHDYFSGLTPLWSDGSLVPGPVLALQRLQAEGNGLSVLPLRELPWPTKCGSNVTSLALLVKAPDHNENMQKDGNLSLRSARQ
jgi:hypothetical protein